MRSSENSVKNSIGRMIFVGISLILQIGWIVLQILKLKEYSVYISLATSVLTLILVLWLYNKRMPMGFKLLWIMTILAFPVLGILLYLMAGGSGLNKRIRNRLGWIDEELFSKLSQEQEVFEDVRKKNPLVANQMVYIRRYAGFPVYENTKIQFFADASEGFEAQLKDIALAERFIFMEYHAVEDAKSFGRLKALLERKVREGVEVRLLYDDMGSIGFLDWKFKKRMEALGIQCRVFNPLLPILSIFMNHRDHRKITVIDGKVGFTGGYNLADEYFNINSPYGHWKDTGIRLEGEAVANLTVQFLELWNVMSYRALEDVKKYLDDSSTVKQKEAAGYVQPYADNPLDEEPVGENVYMNLLKTAKNYVYFTTPYLVISDEMERELCTAAKRGVDVRIITPGIPDKKAVFEVTRSYYGSLVQAGVRIFEYTPGFVHCKECICDDELAVIGTINLDYRSLYLHFENGVLLYECPAVTEMKSDFENTMKSCREVTEDYKQKQPVKNRIKRGFLRVLAPLL